MSAAASPASSAAIATPVTITGTAVGCPHPLYEFWIKYPSGAWTLGQGYSSSPSLSWNTTGQPAGSYLVSVWARDASSPASYDAFTPLPYSLTADPCSGMSATATPPTSTTVGTSVTFTGAATGCPHPLYEFWIKSPSGVWTLAHGYSSNASLVWSTTGKPAGAYLVSVWARDASSSAAYDQFTPVPYTLS
jgi:hypothetical protein